MHDPILIIAEEEDINKRLDKFLAEKLPSLSRMQIQSLIRQGSISAANVPTLKMSAKINTGDSFSVNLPEPTPVSIEAQEMPLDIAYEDEELIVINKPAGLCVHPDSIHKDKTLVNALLYHCAGKLSGIGGEQRPGIVHRLDMDTSGLLVCAKSQAAHIGLAQQFSSHGKDGKLSRAYQALVWGKPPPGPELIDEPIGRHPIHRRKMAVVKLRGKEAQTQFRLIERVGEKASLVLCSLWTGRTHQIRAHLHWRGFPLVGDRIYTHRKNSANKPPIARQALHAYHLGFIHPLTKEAMAFDSPLPDDFQEAIEKLR